MALLKAVHILSTSFFIGFLLLDAFVVRRFLNGECHEKKLLFYERAKPYLYIFAAVIVGSGLLMLYLLSFGARAAIWAKIVLALFALFLFFFSPFIVSKTPKGFVHILYGFITFITAIVVVLAVV